ncbi:MAG: 16S rRNA (cytosine(1402)-N(4))-methyltransferase RsmH [Nocardioidaceae bacterium]
MRPVDGMTGYVAGAAHIPVMPERVVDLLAPALGGSDPVLLDATLGLGGHAEAVLETFPGVHVLGIDRDPAALSAASERLAAYGERLSTVQAVYDQIPQILAERRLGSVDAVLFDLGVSSMQLDQTERGFSYAHDAPLDMRMGDTEMTAADVLNTYSAADLARILREYGEERYARRIATAVVAERGREPFRTSLRLVELIREQIPAPARRTGGNPAKRTFQALRIEVNAELSALRAAVPASLAAIGVGGRVVAMAYQSLEDRIVKRAFVAATTSQAPPGLPVVPPRLQPEYRLLTRGAEQAGDDEVAENPRARSVRVRAVERIADHGRERGSP